MSIIEERSIGDLLKQFQSSLLGELGKDRLGSTARHYTSDIELILKGTEFPNDKVLKTQADYARLVETIDSGVKRIEQSNYRTSTKQRKKVSARSFLSLIREIAEVDIPSFKKECIMPTTIETLTIEQFKKLIEYIPKDGTFMNARDRAVYSLIFYTGVGLGNICRIIYRDFRRIKGKITSLKVRLKYKTRNIFLPDEVSEELKNYGNRYRKTNKKPPLSYKNTPYFRNKWGKGQINPRSIRRNLESYSMNAGLEYFSPLSLRQSYMERQLASGVTVDELAELMGIRPLHIRRIQQRLPYFNAQQNTNL